MTAFVGNPVVPYPNQILARAVHQTHPNLVRDVHPETGYGIKFG
jgi:hypothetical protein